MFYGYFFIPKTCMTMGSAREQILLEEAHGEIECQKQI